MVDVAHRKPNAIYNYWSPDYIIRLTNTNGNTKYLILDAKYSTESWVRSTHLPNIVEKYYWGMSVYNAIKKSYSNGPIAAILVVYPLSVKSAFVRYGRRTSVGNKLFPLPVVGAMGLTVDVDDTFNQIISEILEAVLSSLNY